MSGVRRSATFILRSEAEQWAEDQESFLRHTLVRSGYHRQAPLKASCGLVDLTLAPSPEEIRGASKPYSPICGVYALLVGDEIRYVGQSLDVQARLASHVAAGKVFDRVAIYPCQVDKLLELEASFIATLKPPENHTKSGRLVLPVPRSAIAA